VTDTRGKPKRLRSNHGNKSSKTPGDDLGQKVRPKRWKDGKIKTRGLRKSGRGEQFLGEDCTWLKDQIAPARGGIGGLSKHQLALVGKIERSPSVGWVIDIKSLGKKRKRWGGRWLWSVTAGLKRGHPMAIKRILNRGGEKGGRTLCSKYPSRQSKEVA